MEKKMGQLRINIHQKVVENPLIYIQEVYGITPRSHPQAIRRLVTECAYQTGINEERINEAITSFQQHSQVSDFMLQCCSAKLATQKTQDTISH